MPGELLIQGLVLGAGRKDGEQQQDLALSGLTIFVGPNNSGKSLAVREIYAYALRSGNFVPKLVTKIVVRPLSNDETEGALRTFASPIVGFHFSDRLNYRHRHGSVTINEAEARRVLQDPASDMDRFGILYLSNATINLNGEARLTLCNPRPIGDLQHPDPFNALQLLFATDDLRAEVRKVLFRVFGEYFVLDPTFQNNLRISFSAKPPSSVYEELGLHKEAREFFARCKGIDDYSDGVKAYTGIIVELVAGSPQVVLIDEPEAFLHPPLAQRLGVELSTMAAQSGKNVFVATHSSHFLMGCLQSGGEASVVRLTYKQGKARARVLKNEALSAMMRAPLLRSAGVINALFYDYVVVTESDADRAFYEEINYRLLKYSSGRGIPNCLFLNAQNKQTTKYITGPLRGIGIPTATIVDVDVVKEGGVVWSEFLQSGGIPDWDRSSLATSRERIHQWTKNAQIDLKKPGGIDQLETKHRESAENLFDSLDQYGLFVVRGGELESWLRHLGVQGHTPSWLTNMFERLGSDDSSDSFVRPQSDDVWAFIDKVGAWLMNPERKGMPD